MNCLATINCGLSRWCPKNKVGVMDKTPIDRFYDCMCFQCWLFLLFIYFLKLFTVPQSQTLTLFTQTNKFVLSQHMSSCFVFALYCLYFPPFIKNLTIEKSVPFKITGNFFIFLTLSTRSNIVFKKLPVCCRVLNVEG